MNIMLKTLLGLSSLGVAATVVSIAENTYASVYSVIAQVPVEAPATQGIATYGIVAALAATIYYLIHKTIPDTQKQCTEMITVIATQSQECRKQHEEQMEQVQTYAAERAMLADQRDKDYQERIIQLHETIQKQQEYLLRIAERPCAALTEEER